MPTLTKELVLKALKKVNDPELGMSLVDLGLIYGVKIDNGMVVVDLTFTSPVCPLTPVIISDVETKVKAVKGVKGVIVNIVWDPPWTPERMSRESRLKLGR